MDKDIRSAVQELLNAAMHVSMWAETRPYITASMDIALMFDNLKNSAMQLDSMLDEADGEAELDRREELRDIEIDRRIDEARGK